MKQTNFIVKNFPEKQFTIVKRSFRSSTKPLSLDSTIPIDELTAKTFYHFRTSELFNIWTPPFLMHESQYVTNQRCTAPNTWLTHQLEEDVGYKVLHFINNEDQEAFGYKTLQCTNTATSSEEVNLGKTLSPVTICLNRLFSNLVQLVNSLTALKIILLYV